jgi:hypothetical protein
VKGRKLPDVRPLQRDRAPQKNQSGPDNEHGSPARPL